MLIDKSPEEKKEGEQEDEGSTSHHSCVNTPSGTQHGNSTSRIWIIIALSGYCLPNYWAVDKK
jgi:hypothetical protein